MSEPLHRILDTIETLWPAAGAESWDAVGLVSGDPEADVARVLFAVDAVGDTVDEALGLGADLLLAHHPLLLRGVNTVAESTAKGRVLARLIRGGCALVAAHTNADVVERGTSGELARRLELRDVRPIVPSAPDSDTGLGRVGDLPEPVTLGRLAGALARLLPATATGIRVAGEYSREVRRVAICGGAGDSLLAHDVVTSADVYLTSDLRHHPASEAIEQARVRGTGPSLIDTSHWASEWLWLDVAAAQLRKAHPDLEVVVSERNTDPWTFAIPQ